VRNDHPHTLATRYSLAVILHDQGELEAARAEFEAVLAAERGRLGDDHSLTLATRHGLALVLHDQGDLDRA
jgi:thioredoxin-like negative regulator of GroEL